MRRSRTAAALAAGLFLCLAGSAQAETYSVTRTDDPMPDACVPADCSLREAIGASNSTPAVGDRILIPAAAEPYAVDIDSLDIGDEVELRGDGADRVVLDANQKSILMFINTADPVTLVGLAVTDGKGGIQHNGSHLILRGVSIRDNVRLDGGGGGIQANGRVTAESSFIGFNKSSGPSGAIQNNESATLINTTVAWNESTDWAIGSGNPVSLVSSAVLYNRASESGAGVDGSTISLRGSILAENETSGGVINCDGTVTSLGGNVEDGNSCDLGGGDQGNTAPGLGTLDLHGGTTPVYDLLPGAAAVDAASSCPPFDQRGVPRPSGPACDSGPFELQQPSLSVPAPVALDTSVALGPIAKRLRISRRGVGRLKVTCPVTEQTPPCRGTIVLRERRGRVDKARLFPVPARARFRLAAGESRRVRLKFKRAQLETPGLRRPGDARIRVFDGAGNTALLGRRLRLLLPRR